MEHKLINLGFLILNCHQIMVPHYLQTQACTALKRFANRIVIVSFHNLFDVCMCELITFIASIHYVIRIYINFYS